MDGWGRWVGGVDEWVGPLGGSLMGGGGVMLSGWGVWGRLDPITGANTLAL